MNETTIRTERAKLEAKPIEIKKRKKPSDYKKSGSVEAAELESN